MPTSVRRAGVLAEHPANASGGTASDRLGVCSARARHVELHATITLPIFNADRTAPIST